MDATLYRQTIGSIQYLLLSCRNIAFVVKKLSQFMDAPIAQHWGVVKHLLQYLYGTQTYDIRLQLHNSLSIHAFVMKIGRVIIMIIALRAPVLSSLVLTQFLGIQRSSILLLSLPRNMSIGQLLLPLQNLNMCALFLKNLVSQLALHRLFIVNTLVQHIYMRTQSSTPA